MPCSIPIMGGLLARGGTCYLAEPFALREKPRTRSHREIMCSFTSTASVIMRTVMTPRATTRAVKLHFQFMKRQLYGEGRANRMTEHGPSWQRHPAKRARKSQSSPPSPSLGHVFRNNEVV